jgi:CubicO group peptidase (beta-lactamase class C family)
VTTIKRPIPAERASRGISLSDILSGVQRSLAQTQPMRVATILGLMVVCTLVTDCLAPFYVRGPAPGAPESAFRAALNRQVPRILKQYGVPGMAIGTVLHGDPGQIYVYGLADVARRRPVTPDTVFQVASLSKSVTAWGVLTLVDRGKVDLDQPVQRYLAKWPLAPSPYPSREVTARRLLTHTSGLNAGEDEFRTPGDPAPTTLELLRREGPPSKGEPTPAVLTGPAGAAFVYSVPGYTLLQLMIEQQSRRPFATYMRNAVLRPLGMTSSDYAWDPRLRAATATPYLEDGKPSDLLIPEDTAADGLFSTVNDMVQFVAAPMPGQGLPTGAGVISDRTTQQIFLRPSALPKGQLQTIGPDAPCLGCFIEHSDGGPVMITNAGDDPGWTAEIHMAPATGDGLVVLTNSSRASPAIAQVEAMWAGWRGFPPPQVTRTYQSMIVFAVAVVSLVSVLAIAAGFGCLTEVAGGARRFAAFNTHACLKSLLEWALAASLIWPFLLLRTVIELLPRFATISELILMLLVAAVLARALFPETRTPRLATA